MRLCFLVSAILLGGSGAFAGPCLPGTLQNYINLGSGGCTSGFALFKDFSIAPGQSFAIPIAPAQVLVTPGGPANMPALQFTLGNSATTGFLLESFFRFDISAASLLNATVRLNNPSATGDGAAIASLDICPNASFIGNAPLGCPTLPASLIAFKTADSESLSDTRNFGATSFFDVFADLTIDGGLAGTARLDSATVQVTATGSTAAIPEPATALLLIMGSGVLALGRFRRHL